MLLKYARDVSVTDFSRENSVTSPIMFVKQQHMQFDVSMTDFSYKKNATLVGDVIGYETNHTCKIWYGMLSSQTTDRKYMANLWISVIK